MNASTKPITRLAVVAGLALAALQAQASPAAPSEGFRWFCERGGAPSVAEIRDHFGIANAGQACQWRGVVHRYLQHKCRRAARMAQERTRNQERLAEAGARAP
ncbi:MAG: hypothetical protein ACYCUX_00585 [Metallibacterium sp.]